MAYFKNGIFTVEIHGRRALGLPLLKYTCRVLKKLPRVKPYPSDITAAALTPWIEAQLRFIRDVIQPQLRPWTPRTKKVGRDKLADLWQHRRKKAIEIILNNSEYPETLPCPNNVHEVQSYYFDKCQGSTLIDDAPLPPPWDALLQSPEPEFLPVSSPFTEDELRNVLDSLPHNKSTGSDGVMYETLKCTHLKETLLPIFNTCLINRRVPESWKDMIKGDKLCSFLLLGMSSLDVYMEC